MLFNENSFWSAVKRKDMINLLELLFNNNGEYEAAEIVKNTSRLTDAAIKRIRETLGSTNEEKPVEEPVVDYQDAINEEAEKNSELIKLEKKVRKAIEAGDKKKAKKALKKLKATGIEGTEIEKLEEEVKGL